MVRVSCSHNPLPVLGNEEDSISGRHFKMSLTSAVKSRTSLVQKLPKLVTALPHYLALYVLPSWGFDCSPCREYDLQVGAKLRNGQNGVCQ